MCIRDRPEQVWELLEEETNELDEKAEAGD
jgi:hypothetical protein